MAALSEFEYDSSVAEFRVQNKALELDDCFLKLEGWGFHDRILYFA
jgi:hypothetical protein